MTEAKTRQKTARLSGNLGVGSIVFMVIAAAAPLTVIGGNVPLAIGIGNGVGAPFGFLIASLILLVFAVGFVAMTPHVKEAGAFYSYISQGLGLRAGMGSAYLALVTYTAIQAGVYGYMGWAVNDLVVHYGGTAHPWWMYSVLAIAAVAILGYRHIDLSSRILGIALVLEIGVVLIMNFSILSEGGAQGVSLVSFEPKTAFTHGLGMSVLFALTGFIGFESTAIFRDESRNPEKTIPRATYLAVIIIGVFYTFSAWALITGAGYTRSVAVANDTLNGTGNMLLDIARQYNGALMSNVIQVLLISSIFACVLSFHNVLSRYQYVLAGQGFMPKFLSAVHGEHKSPCNASLAQSATALLLITVCAACKLQPLTQVFGYMAAVSTVGIVLLMLLTSVAVVAFFKKNTALAAGKHWRTRIIPAISVLALSVSLIMVLSNFTTLTGGSMFISTLLAIIPVAALVTGYSVINKRQILVASTNT
ncbi:MULTISPECIES: APC family permease [Tatumella]|uniref:APC family permease n=1 Tax=Tatumella punctata TaxID=399969 RepID=A0ABW1VS21_9GAMM|nr:MULTISPECIES: APC family permease [unclassified Tatumella]MBS0856723.1 APC family permease [Tatumella sp. JGM16]MBS0877722.1 APC family permease [Tatumella sp. JGM82]MBS0891489.1 APC family permease [Tatumella sp. JGM94]MBS0894470.1 APC family permease [Tatumella sp. JGM130]MBS0902357.1 APC family permease [Tatumella sp. JGM100]